MSGEGKMSVITKIETILANVNAYNLLPDMTAEEVFSICQQVANGYEVALPKYSKHQYNAAEIASKTCSYTPIQILKALATLHPPLLSKKAQPYENWEKEHSINELNLAELWRRNSEAVEIYTRSTDIDFSSNMAKDLSVALKQYQRELEGVFDA